MWYRVKEFQLVGLVLIAEQLLLSCAAYENRAALPLYIPRMLTTTAWVFRPSLSIYASPNNAGAERLARELADSCVSKGGTASL